MMTPKHSGYPNVDPEMRDLSWKGLPTWARFGMIWGPLGVIFGLFVWGIVLISGDVRAGVKARFNAEVMAMERISAAVEKQQELAEKSQERWAEVSRYSRETDGEFRASLLKLHETSEQTIKLMQSAEQMMQEAPKDRKQLIASQNTTNELLQQLIEQRKPLKDIPAPNGP